MNLHATLNFSAIFALLTCCALLPAASASTENMRAMVFSNGSLQARAVPRPQPQAGQVRIRVRAASVNPVDWKLADRAAPGSESIPGRDLSGIVDAVGPGVRTWKVGDEVIAIASGGSYAEYALASISAIARKPAGMSFEEAAGIGVVAETAWRAIVTVADVQNGQTVLIHGGAGGVGSSAVQIAKARGARVIATASPRNHEFLRALGADEVIDYNTVRFEERVAGIDMVLNTVDLETAERSTGVLKRGGVLVSVAGGTPAERCAAAGIRCPSIGSVNGEMLSHIVELAAAGKFRVHVDRRLPLAEAATGWESSRRGHTRGKIVLLVGS